MIGHTDGIRPCEELLDHYYFPVESSGFIGHIPPLTYPFVSFKDSVSRTLRVITKRPSYVVDFSIYSTSISYGSSLFVPMFDYGGPYEFGPNSDPFDATWDITCSAGILGTVTHHYPGDNPPVNMEMSQVGDGDGDYSITITYIGPATAPFTYYTWDPYVGWVPHHGEAPYVNSILIDWPSISAG